MYYIAFVQNAARIPAEVPIFVLAPTVVVSVAVLAPLGAHLDPAGATRRLKRGRGVRGTRRVVGVGMRRRGERPGVNHLVPGAHMQLDNPKGSADILHASDHVG